MWALLRLFLHKQVENISEHEDRTIYSQPNLSKPHHSCRTSLFGGLKREMLIFYPLLYFFNQPNLRIMKKQTILLFIVFFTMPFIMQAQRWKTASKFAKTAWRWAENALTAKEIYDWVNDDRYTTNYYISPNGTWRSSSGNYFYVSATQGGFAYRNANDSQTFYPSWTGTTNFYYIDFYDQWGYFAYRYYYSVVDRNTIYVNSTLGDEYVWRRQ